MYFPQTWLNLKSNGTITWYHQKVLPRSNEVCFDNRKFLGQFLCPALGDGSRRVTKKEWKSLIL
jgi:hypothetical protein